jgi:O-antigen/teichoic acid export membrane protein
LPKVDKPNFKEIHLIKSFKKSFLFFIPVISSTVNAMLDQSMLGFISDTSQVGYYQAGYRITSMVISLICAISPVILTRISYLYKTGDINGINSKTKKVFEVLWGLGIPAVFGIYCTAQLIVPVVFGGDFYPAINILYFLCPTILLNSSMIILGAVYFYPTHQEGKISLFILFGTILNLLGNIFGIKYYGATGAAFVSCLTEIVELALYIAFSFKVIDFKKVLFVAIKPLASSLIMCVTIIIVMFLLNLFNLESIWKLIILVVVGMFVYGIFLIILKFDLAVDLLKRIRKKN